MTKEGWRKTKWGEIATLEYGKSLINYKARKGSFPVYGTNGVIGNTDKPLCVYPSVIIGRKGAYRGVHYSKTPFFVIDTAFYLKPNKADLDLKFAYYQLLTQNINEMDSGSAIPSTSREDFYNLDLLLPDKKSQQDIACILSSLDDKIELYLQMNKTLEAIAQTIFKEWFVDFRFPGFDGVFVDGLPKGWTELPIGTLFSYNVGGDWGKEEPSEDFPIRVAIIRGTDFGSIQNGDISRVPIRFIKKVNLDKKKIVNGDILLEISGGSNDQPTGRTILLTDPILGLFDCPVVPASFCRLIRSVDFNHAVFLSTFMKLFYSTGGTWEYQNRSTGISNFQFTYFSKNKKLTIPDDSLIIENYGIHLKSLIEKIHQNIYQIRTLTDIRDTLLPKLVTGKIRVT